MKKLKKAFTLIELIVTITILAILWTIAFISLQWYSLYTRNSVRLSDLSNLDKQLWIKLIKSWKIPKPDNFVEITSSWEIVLYQWIAWENTLWILWIFNWWKDPLNESYYPYTTNSNFTKYQVIWFLEDSWFSSVIRTYALESYSNRVLVSKWYKIWILLEKQTNIPIKSNLDLLNTQEEFKFYFSEDDYLTWTWYVLKWWIWWGWLVWYWTFDELSWTWFTDYSYNNTISSFSWWVTLTWWVLWNAIYLDWIDWEFNVASIQWLWVSANSPHTISAWLNIENIIDGEINNYNRQWILLLWQRWTWSHLWLIWGRDWPTQFWSRNIISTRPNLPEKQWVHVSIVYDWYKLIYYTNWIRGIENNNLQSKWMNIKNSKLNLWKKQNITEKYFSWAIDDLRVYNRVLIPSEIKLLYDIWK